MGVESEVATMVRERPAVGSARIARRLRWNPTDAERRMWHILRKCFPSARFRRQVPLGRYVADFCSHSTRLVVEVDGGQHVEAIDAPRTRFMRTAGYRVIRFWNHDVLGNSDGVALAVAEALHERHPHPNPPPSRGRESKERPPCPA